MKIKTPIKVFISFLVTKIADRAMLETTVGPMSAKLSTLPDAPRKPRQKRVVDPNKKRREQYKFLKQYVPGQVNKTSSWKDVSPKSTISGFAVPRRQYDVIIGNRQVGPKKLSSIIHELGIDVYGITENKYDTLREKLGLKDLEEHLRPILAKRLKFSKYELSRLKHGFYLGGVLEHALVRTDDLPEACNDYVKLIETNSDKAVTTRKLANLMGVKINMDNAKNYQREFYDRYPLLDSMYISQDNIKHAIEYIKLKG